MKIAVIPARGGSKRIPRKNIKWFCAKPMIAWSIETAKASELFDHIIVSTDDSEIANISISYGAEVPFTRPAELSDDFTGTNEVVAHSVNWALNENWPISEVCCIYATAPFIQLDDLRRGLHELQSKHWDFVFSACEFAAPVFRSLKSLENGGVEMFFPEHYLTRSQDLPVALHDAGQFYWGKKEAWLQGKAFFNKNSFALNIPKWRVQDIDTPDDWKRAELMHQIIFNQI